MKIEQVEQIKDILKVVDRAVFNGVTLNDMITNVNMVNRFAKATSELQNEVNGVIKKDEKSSLTPKSEVKKDVKSK